jgi:hypothetical protein
MYVETPHNTLTYEREALLQGMCTGKARLDELGQPLFPYYYRDMARA